MRIKRQELDELGHGQLELVIVGTRTRGAAHIVPEMESRGKRKNVNVLVQPSYDAVAEISESAEQKKMVGGLIHITCQAMNLVSV